MFGAPLIAVLTLAVLSPGYSYAQSWQSCGAYSTFQKNLLNKYDERAIARGLGSSGRTMYEVYKSPDGATWTFIVVLANGKACVIASGQYFTIDAAPETLTPKTKETPERLPIGTAR
jgi:hypothetical protein